LYDGSSCWLIMFGHEPKYNFKIVSKIWMRFHMNFSLKNEFDTNAFNAYHHELAGIHSTFAVVVTKNLRRAHAFQLDSQHNVLDDCVLYFPFLRMATDPAVKTASRWGRKPHPT